MVECGVVWCSVVHHGGVWCGADWVLCGVRQGGNSAVGDKAALSRHEVVGYSRAARHTVGPLWLLVLSVWF